MYLYSLLCIISISELGIFFIFLDRIPEYPQTILNDIESDLNIINELKGL